MKIRLQIIIVILVCTVLNGCGGARKPEDINESELSPPAESTREAINARAYNYFINGSILETLGEIGLANQQFAEALKYYPNSPEIRYSYASTFMKLRQFQRALQEAQKVSPKDSKTWLLIAGCYRALGRQDSAMISYREVVGLDSTNLEAYYRLATNYIKNNLLDSAVWAYQNIARISPSPKAHEEIGNLQMQAGQPGKAIESYLESLKLDSSQDNMKSYLGLTLAYEETGDSARALRYLETAAAMNRYNVAVQDKLLRYYQKAGELQKAIIIAKTITSLAPDDNDLKRRLALLYFQVDSLRQADSIFTELLEIEQDNVIDLYYSGRIALAFDDFDMAEAHFNRLTAVADSIVDGWLNLGYVYRLKNSADLELAAYENGLEYMHNLDDSTRLLYAMGGASERYGRFDRAVEIFEKIVRLRPEYSPALNYLGYMLADRGIRLDYARILIEKALAIMPENGAYIDSYGWLFFRLGEYHKALEHLLRAYEYIDNDPVIADHIGDVYEALGDNEMANQYWNKALQLDPDNETLKEKLKK
jgi:tetratricopeptide (TPR) repeat protein